MIRCFKILNGSKTGIRRDKIQTGMVLLSNLRMFGQGRNFKIGGSWVNTIEYVDELVILATDEGLLQKAINRDQKQSDSNPSPKNKRMDRGFARLRRTDNIRRASRRAAGEEWRRSNGRRK